MSEEDGDFNGNWPLVVRVWGVSYAYHTRMDGSIRVWVGLECVAVLLWHTRMGWVCTRMASGCVSSASLCAVSVQLNSSMDLGEFLVYRD